MWTREELKALDGADKTEAFKDLLLAVYGSREPVRRVVCEDLTITEQAFRRWIREDVVQTWALLLLREWALTEPQERVEQVAWAETVRTLARVAEELSRLRSQLTDLVELPDAVQEHSDGDGPEPLNDSQQ